MRPNEMKITPNRFVSILISLLAASALLSLTGAVSGNPVMHAAGLILLIAVAPVVALQSWYGHRTTGDDTPEEQ